MKAKGPKYERDHHHVQRRRGNRLRLDGKRERLSSAFESTWPRIPVRGWRASYGFHFPRRISGTPKSKGQKSAYP